MIKLICNKIIAILKLFSQADVYLDIRERRKCQWIWTWSSGWSLNQSIINWGWKTYGDKYWWYQRIRIGGKNRCKRSKGDWCFGGWIDLGKIDEFNKKRCQKCKIK